MESEIIYYNPDSYLETVSGNKLSKKSLIRGSDQIQPSGKAIMQEGSIIRGDLAKIKMGKYVILCEKVTLRPTYRKQKGGIKFIDLQIGEYVVIDQNTIISALKIGSYVKIGKNCIISHRCIINDNSMILDDSILPPDTTVPPYTVYGGKPAVFVAELPETVTQIHKEMAINFYNNFVPKKPEPSRASKEFRDSQKPSTPGDKAGDKSASDKQLEKK